MSKKTMYKDRIFDLIEKEKKRQEDTLMMIPSENYTYKEVMRAVGSALMHKYAEGYPQKRYYQGNEVVDEIEDLCQERALEAFGLDNHKWRANVQPHSGCEANLAVYNALLAPGDKIMAMYLPDGGHLSHGWHTEERKVTLVSKIFKVEFYKVDPKTRVFDYDEIEKQAEEFGPKLIISGGTAYPREIDYERMGRIAKKAGAYYLADVAHEAGLIAARVCRSPFESADVVTMTTHKTLRGPRGAMILAKTDLIEKVNLAVMPGLQGGPHVHSIAGIAIALEKSKTEKFRDDARQVVANAKKLAEVLMAGLAGAGLDVVSGGTDKHLILVDLRNKRIGGWHAAWAMEKAGIIINRNTVPNEDASPFYPSGIRLGTPALTVRGMKEMEMEKIGGWILKIIGQLGAREMAADKEARAASLKKFLEEIKNDEVLKGIRQEVRELCGRFPLG
jgi:glycine hydroxymethyltransferase